jgi:hypothetical protein
VAVTSTATITVAKNTRSFSGGVDGTVGVAKQVLIEVGGTVETGDQFNVRLGDYNYGYVSKPVGPSSFALTLGKKVYITSGTLLNFSAVNSATEWDQEFAIGAGFINMLNSSTGGEVLNSLAAYGNRLAILARRTIQLWSVDVDPDRNDQSQVLSNIGAVAPRSVTQIGDVDVFFLADSGIRSLRSRNINNIAFSADIGNPIDQLVVDAMLEAGAEAAEAAVAVIEPTDGRYWLAIANQIFVFSFFQSSKIAAWSTYLPGFTPTDFATYNGRVWVRDTNDKLYLYGGDDNVTYDDDAYRADNPVQIELPFLSTGTPSTFKTFTGMDAVVEGEFNCYMGTNPQEPDDRDLLARLAAPSFDMRHIPVNGYGTHFSVKLTKTTGGYGRVSNFTIHYAPDEAG